MSTQHGGPTDRRKLVNHRGTYRGPNRQPTLEMGDKTRGKYVNETVGHRTRGPGLEKVICFLLPEFWVVLPSS